VCVRERERERERVLRYFVTARGTRERSVIWLSDECAVGE